VAADPTQDQGVSGRPLHVALRGITKRFGGVHALRGVDLDIGRGTIHGLVGENGAGKSTLAKVIAGVHRCDEGTMAVNGQRVDYRSPREALGDGIALIAQELSLVPELSVMQNVFLGVQESRAGVLRRNFDRVRFEKLRHLGFDLPMNAPVRSLRIADQQRVEILRAIARSASLIVMDEPTASLTSVEASTLYEIIRDRARGGTTIILVSHALNDILALCDSITIMRDGGVVRTGPARAETTETVVTAMIGRSLGASFPEKQPPSAEAPIVFAARHLKVDGTVNDVSLEVRAGEILGLAGLIGSGRSELAHAIFAADRLDAGELELDGRRLALKNPRQAVRAGIAMVPESRKEQGLVMVTPVSHNISLPHLRFFQWCGVVRVGAERQEATALCEQVDVRGVQPRGPVANLSGGNQQKVLFAKWLVRRPRLLIADEPTRGVDVGAKLAIYELLASLARDGLAIVVISSDLEEVIGLAHRVLVMRNGRVAGELDATRTSEEDILRLAFGTDSIASAAS
jgi:ABC-type sugar transport system ATPase subunit